MVLPKPTTAVLVGSGQCHLHCTHPAAMLVGIAWSAENIEPWKLYEVYVLV